MTDNIEVLTLGIVEVRSSIVITEPAPVTSNVLALKAKHRGVWILSTKNPNRKAKLHNRFSMDSYRPDYK